MKKLPMLNQGFENFNKLFFESIRKDLMMTGIELKIFNLLSKSMTAEAIARSLSTDLQNTIHFLDGLTAGGFINKEDGFYCNTAQTQTFLVEGSPTYLGEYFKVQEESKKPALDNMLELIKNGKTAINEKASSEELGAKMIERCANSQRAGMGQQMAKFVSSLHEFPKFKKMLDLGGGSGLICIAIISEHPSMRGIIFDLPLVTDVTKKFISEYEMNERIETMQGNYFKDSIGKGYDLIWASMTLNFAKDQLDPIMKKIFSALNPGGVFINFNDGLTHENTKPKTIVLNWLSPALMGKNYALPKNFIANSMIKTGFKSVQSQPVQTHVGIMEIDIARK
ncbi:MAG: methyltransferase [Bacteroidetes bacterium]|nr:methyltransferase [Bacteroidota bacterium]